MPDEGSALVIDESVGARIGRTSFRELYRPVPESIGKVRAELSRFISGCGVPEHVRQAVALAVSEAATNVVVHAYRDGVKPGLIEVAAAVAADELWVIVTDTGVGLRPHPDSRGPGLGLAIIAQMADGVDLVRPTAGGLELRMRFQLASQGTEASRSRERESLASHAVAR